MSDDDDDDGPHKPTREALWQRLAVGCVDLLIRGVGAMPTWLAYTIGALLAVPWFLFWSRWVAVRESIRDQNDSISRTNRGAPLRR